MSRLIRSVCFVAALLGATTHFATPADSLPSRTLAVRPRAASAPHLQYFGGRVLTHVAVDVVVWGSWSYGTSVPLSGAHSVGSFVGGITRSQYLDSLTEYNTPSQTIGRGSLDGVYHLTPVAPNNGSVVTSGEISGELTHDISTGVLPRPSANRVYLLLFHRGQVISTPFGDSRSTFCAYHDTISYPRTSIFIAVLPYQVSNPGCHPAANSFDNLTTIASHELAEAITDPGVGLNKLSWYDRANGEIADICARTRPGTVIGGDGVRYVVQREWSNRSRACVL